MTRCRSSVPSWSDALRVFEGTVSTQTTTGPVEKSVFCVSGESMVARLKLKGIDGKGTTRSGACSFIRLNTGKLTRSRHSKDSLIDGFFFIFNVVVHGRFLSV